MQSYEACSASRSCCGGHTWVGDPGFKGCEQPASSLQICHSAKRSRGHGSNPCAHILDIRYIEVQSPSLHITLTGLRAGNHSIVLYIRPATSFARCGMKDWLYIKTLLLPCAARPIASSHLIAAVLFRIPLTVFVSNNIIFFVIANCLPKLIIRVMAMGTTVAPVAATRVGRDCKYKA